MPHINLELIATYFKDLQDHICTALEGEEPTATFHEDTWQRQSGGGGRTRSIEAGNVLERGGVNFSHVFGDNLPPSASAERPQLADREFQAMGISLVLHPKNPYAPTSHLNLRFFIAGYEEADPIWWFGGGYDLTPYYGFEEDCTYWHSTAKAACDPFGVALYPRYKKWCDEYFYLKHRQEARGIGGLFFDDINTGDFEHDFAFIQSIGESFLKAYLPILQNRKETRYGEKEREFQLIRRGRYVEFNLVYDRGTLFGLQSQGRTESILVSLPPIVEWRYDWVPEPRSREAGLYTDFLPAKDWLELEKMAKI